MRPLVSAFCFSVFLAALIAPPVTAQDSPLVPPKRFSLSQNVDLPGGDIASVFDTTLEACERACLTNTRCTAFTFNTRNGSCFPKANPGEGTIYQGALSAQVLQSTPGAEALAQQLLADLSFLGTNDIASARVQAETMGRTHLTNGFSAEEHLQAAAEAERQNNPEQAARFVGAAVNLTDSGADWAEYARLLLAASDRAGGNAQTYRQRTVQAATNAYLRTQNPALRHSILLTMARALEQVGRGRDTVQALRLAQALQSRDDTAALLDDAIGKYGFRIVENAVQADSVRPRLCVTFSEELVKSGVDYESYVQLPEPGLTVTTEGRRDLCVEGLAHGSR